MNAKHLVILAVVVLVAGLLGGGSVSAKNMTKAGQPPPRVLVKGAPIHGANGLNFDSQNRLYVGSVWGDEIVVMDPDSGRILNRLGAAQGVRTPDDLTFGPDGSLYWTAIISGEVGRLAPNGTKSTVAMLPPGVNPITFSDDGRLFVGLCFLGQGLYEVYPNGASPRLITRDISCINAFDFGPDGYLYAPMLQEGRIVKINVDTAEFTTVATGFPEPAAVKFDSQGRLYVVDNATREITRMNLQTQTREVITRLEGVDNLAFDARGRLFASDAQHGTVYEIMPNGKPRKLIPYGMITPGGVAYLPGANGHGSVYVADLWALRQYDAQTGNPRPLGNYLRPPLAASAQFWTVAPFGNQLLVTALTTGLVQTVNPVSGQITTCGAFALPTNAIQFGDELVVAQLGTGSVVRQTCGGGQVTLASGLAYPTGLAASNDDLWVADWAMGAVLQIVKDGTVLTNPIPVATGLVGPEGLALEPDGNLLVVEAAAGRLSRIHLPGREVTPVAERLALGASIPDIFFPTAFFNGVAVSPSGTIYVTGDKTNVLYRIDPRGK